MDGQKLGPVHVAHTHDFAKGKTFNQKLLSFPKLSKLGDMVS